MLCNKSFLFLLVAYKTNVNNFMSATYCVTEFCILQDHKEYTSYENYKNWFCHQQFSSSKLSISLRMPRIFVSSYGFCYGFSVAFSFPSVTLQNFIKFTWFKEVGQIPTSSMS